MNYLIEIKEVILYRSWSSDNGCSGSCVAKPFQQVGGAWSSIIGQGAPEVQVQFIFMLNYFGVLLFPNLFLRVTESSVSIKPQHQTQSEVTERSRGWTGRKWCSFSGRRGTTGGSE